MITVRTIKEAAAHFKNMDAETCLTENAIRRLIITGAVPSSKVGRKYLVSIETLEEYLKGTTEFYEPDKVSVADSANTNKKSWRLE